jgi:anion-transporting  ArsA/GET3 family ATPase
MELVIEPDVYAASIDENGKYVDNIISFHRLKKGLMCPCGSRKDKVYETHGTFSTHIKTKNHQKWLENLNLNRANYYVESEQLRVTVQNQRLIIAELEKGLQNKAVTIDYLTQQLIHIQNNKVVTNLLDFD